MKNRIIEICELGQPQSIIHRENQPITELIKTTDLVDELNEQLRIGGVVGRSEQLFKLRDNCVNGVDDEVCRNSGICKYCS